MRMLACTGMLLASLLMAGHPSRADPESDANFLASATVNDASLKVMHSIMMPLLEAGLRSPHEGQRLTERARVEFMAIFEEQFDYLMRKDMVAAQKKAYLTLYSPDELAKIRILFESEAWQIIQLRGQAHQEALVSATTANLESVSKYVMARLTTRARDEQFEILETPGVLQRLQNVLGNEKP